MVFEQPRGETFEIPLAYWSSEEYAVCWLLEDEYCTGKSVSGIEVRECEWPWKSLFLKITVRGGRIHVHYFTFCNVSGLPKSWASRASLGSNKENFSCKS